MPNGLRYLRVGGCGFALGAEKNSKRGKCLKMPQNPTRQVHALLAGVELEDSFLFYRAFSKLPNSG